MGQLGLAGRPKPQRSDRLYELGRAQDAADEIAVNVRPQAAVIPAWPDVRSWYKADAARRFADVGY
jgi:hypothetical protein